MSDDELERRKVEALETIAEELRFQNAVLSEQARAQHLTAVAGSDYAQPDENPTSAPNTRSLLSIIEDQEFERENADEKRLISDGGQPSIENVTVERDSVRLSGGDTIDGYRATYDGVACAEGVGYSEEDAIAELIERLARAEPDDLERPMADRGAREKLTDEHQTREKADQCDEQRCDNVATVAIEALEADDRRDVCLDHAISVVGRIGREESR